MLVFESVCFHKDTKSEQQKGGGGCTRGALPKGARALVLQASACSDGSSGIRLTVATIST